MTTTPTSTVLAMETTMDAPPVDTSREIRVSQSQEIDTADGSARKVALKDGKGKDEFSAAIIDDKIREPDPDVLRSQTFDSV